MMSTRTLSKHLIAFGAATAPFTAQDLKGFTLVSVMAKGYSITNETCGRKSMVYIGCPTKLDRLRLEKYLADRGAKVNRNYSPNSPNTEVQVSYFKGTRWDE